MTWHPLAGVHGCASVFDRFVGATEAMELVLMDRRLDRRRLGHLVTLGLGILTIQRVTASPALFLRCYRNFESTCSRTDPAGRAAAPEGLFSSRVRLFGRYRP